MLSFRVLNIRVASSSHPFLIFLILKLFRFCISSLSVFFKFYIVILTSADFHEAVYIFNLAKGTVLATILNNIANSVFK